MNKVVLIGRLTKTPEVRYNQNNVAIATFTLAVNRPTKNGEEQADFILCKCFNNLAINLAKFQEKGSQLAVYGQIRTGSYDGKDGNKVYTTEVITNEITYLSSKKSDSTTTGNLTQTEEMKFDQMSAKTVMNEDYNPELQINDSDLPFSGLNGRNNKRINSKNDGLR